MTESANSSIRKSQISLTVNEIDLFQNSIRSAQAHSDAPIKIPCTRRTIRMILGVKLYPRPDRSCFNRSMVMLLR